jgi:protein kinase-like protein
MGAVFLGIDEALAGREVAIKFMTLGRDETTLKRFQREAEVTAQLDHPHVIRIHGAGLHGEQAYLVYELVAGRTSLADSFAGASLDQRLDWIEQVAAGLSAAHARGIVHRDLKPENVLVRPDGEAVVVDFGLAGLDSSSLTNTGQVLGTPAYMSPEQIRGDPTAPSCDVWSLGVLLYEALYERHPFLEPGITLPFLMAKVYGAQAEFPRGPAPALRGLLRSCLQEDAAKRPPDAGAFERALRAARAAKGAGSQRWAPFALLLLVLSLAAGGAWASGLVGGEVEDPSPRASVTASAEPAHSPAGIPSPGPNASPQRTPRQKFVSRAEPRRRLPAPEFRLDLRELKAKRARFISNEEALFVGRGGRAQLWRLGKLPVALGSTWLLPTSTESCLVDTVGLRVVAVSGDCAWQLVLPDREAIPLPRLPFTPDELHVWERGTRFYVLVANDTRVACGVLGAPLRELDVRGHKVRGVAGAVNRVAVLARKLPLGKAGLLLFDLGDPGARWVPAVTPCAIALSPTAEKVFLGSRFGSLEVRSGDAAASTTMLVAAHEGSLRHVAWSGDRLAAASKHSLSIWSEGDLSRPLYHQELPGGSKGDEILLSPGADLVIVRRNSEFLGWRLPLH